jgi:hypothetical protein
MHDNTGQRPSERLMREVGALMQEMTRAGKLIGTVVANVAESVTTARFA